MSRPGAFWFAVAGVSAITRWALEFVEIEYYDPQSLLDYSGVVLQSSAGVATGIALVILWREPPVRRASLLLLLAGLAAISQGLGNLFEDAFGWEWGVWGFFIGGVGLIFTLAIAGIVTLRFGGKRRWIGLPLLLGSTGGLLGFGLLVMGLSWLVLSAWIYRSPLSPDR